MMVENSRQRTAFECYRKMGASRSLEGVSDQMSIPVSTLKKWSSRFSWRRRLCDPEASQTERDMEELRDKLLAYANRLPIDAPNLPNLATGAALLHSAIHAAPAMIVAKPANGNGSHN